jgi:1L-myo-inositol 1-phosphate cytidylyltransferase / CDP-L-myo-inositol myo-inositolphosphotransferase
VTESLLVIVAAGAASDITPETMVAGLPLGRRQALAGARAGLSSAPSSEPGRRRVILVPSNVIPQPRWLRALAAMPLQPETLWVDPAQVAVVDTDDPKPVLDAAGRASSAAECVATLKGRFATIEGTADHRGRFALRAAGDLRQAESWLLRSLIKDSEGFMSRHVERLISLALTRRLVWTSVTPNAMTLVSLAIGLAAAPFFVSSAPGWQLAGALLFLLHSILDGCDGEIARLKFLESPGGAALDFWGDNTVHVAVFGCMGVGWSLSAHSAWPLAVAALAVASTLAAAFVEAPRMVRPSAAAPPRSAGARTTDALANRDFIYLIVALSAFGKAAWFIVFVAIGTPIFVLVRLWVDRPQGRA